MASTIKSHLATNKPIILDGALATYLETLGADISTALWSATLLSTNPSLIKKTHFDYFTAGANVAITASYQASIKGLVEHLHITEPEAKELVKKSVQLAQQARDSYLSNLPEDAKQTQKTALWIAGSVGPYGAYLANGSEYRGDYHVEQAEMMEFHRGRIAALVEAGVDLLAIETIPSFEETRALVALLASEPRFRLVPVWFCFTVQERDAGRISDGTPFADVVDLLKGCANAVAVGVNCVKQDVALGALERLASLTEMPLVVYPNSGEEWDAQRREWMGCRNENEKLAERARQYRDAGARLVGGCCRMGPGDIRVVAQTLREGE